MVTGIGVAKHEFQKGSGVKFLMCPANVAVIRRPSFQRLFLLG